MLGLLAPSAPGLDGRTRALDLLLRLELRSPHLAPVAQLVTERPAVVPLGILAVVEDLALRAHHDLKQVRWHRSGPT